MMNILLIFGIALMPISILGDGNIVDVVLPPEVDKCVASCLGEDPAGTCHVRIQCPFICPGDLVWDEKIKSCVWSHTHTPKTRTFKRSLKRKTAEECMGECAGLDAIGKCKVNVNCQPACVGDLKMKEESCKCVKGDLIEVPVGKIVNAAVKKLATQSSTYSVYNASRAVDALTKCSSGYESRTNSELNAWWSVDLGENFYISQIYLKSIRLRNFFIGISQRPFGSDPVPGAYPVCRNEPSSISSTTTLSCYSAMTGRYVIIQLANHKSHVELCEVEVRGKALR